MNNVKFLFYPMTQKLIPNEPYEMTIGTYLMTRLERATYSTGDVITTETASDVIIALVKLIKMELTSLQNLS